MPPLYDLNCPACGRTEERQIPLASFSELQCCTCGGEMRRVILSAPLSRMAGVIPQGGGPDRFTADMMGIPLKDLPEGLKV